VRHTSSLVVGTLALTILGARSAAAQPVVTPVMTKLDNPRGLAFGPGGALFVAEAGYGGAPCPPVPPGGVTLSCYGLTGAISRLWHGQQDRVVSGLPSISFRFGASARGPHDIALRLHGGPPWSALGGPGAHVTVGLEADPATREAFGRPDLGKLVHIPLRALYAPSAHLCDHDCWEPIVDIAALEIGGGPDNGVSESDPYGLIAEPRRHRSGHHGDFDGEDEHLGSRRHHDEDGDEGEEGIRGSDVVVDASGNSLLRVNTDGEISLLAVFPSRSTTPPRPAAPGVAPTDSVPTSVAVGPDGAYYVAELVGVPFATATRPKSNIYRVAPGQDPYHPTVFLDGQVTGFNAIIDIAFKGSDLYILQHWTLTQTPTQPPTTVMAPGRLVRVACGGRPLVCDGLHPTTVLDLLEGPTAIVVGPDGALYLSNKGASPAFANPPAGHDPKGEVLRIDLGDGDGDHHGHDDDRDGHDHDGRHHEGR
jgi:hypothetical protein